MKIVVGANCQAHGLAACVRAMVPDAEVHAIHIGLDTTEPAKNSDIILLQTEFSSLSGHREFWGDVQASAFKLIPSFYYPAFHPDIVYAKIGDNYVQSPMLHYNSALVLYGWLNNLSPTATVRLFCQAVFDHLNYFGFVEQSRNYLIEAGVQCGIDMVPLIAEWSKRGCFAYSVNHPKLFVLSSIVRAALKQCGVKETLKNPAVGVGIG